MKKIIVLLVMFFSSMTFSMAADYSTDAMLQYNHGIDYYKTGQFESAVIAFRNAINLDPDFIDAYYNLGSTYEYLGQNEAALAVFKQIVVRQPNDYESVYKAAWLSAQLGQYQKAKDFLKIIPPEWERSPDVKSLMTKVNSALVNTPAPAVVSKPVSQSNFLYQNLTSPTGITTDYKGNVYVAGFTDNSITKITPDDRRIIFAKDSKIDGPIGLACDKLGNIYVANYNKNNVLKISTTGETTVLIGNVQKPYYLYLTGNTLFVSCQGSSSVLKYKI